MTPTPDQTPGPHAAAGTPAQVVVLAKSPIAGRVKTRLTPAYTSEEAAELATACLRDTLAAALGSRADRVTLALDGEPGDWASPDVVVLPQRGVGLDERIELALADCWRAAPGLPLLLIGMDTPQLDVGRLRAALTALTAPDCDAVLGPATDGGFWALGVRRPRPGLVRDVPMSTGRTGSDQLGRLRGAGLRVTVLETLSDVDTAADAWSVAQECPTGAFATAVRRLGRRDDDAARAEGAA